MNPADIISVGVDRTKVGGRDEWKKYRHLCFIVLTKTVEINEMGSSSETITIDDEDDEDDKAGASSKQISSPQICSPPANKFPLFRSCIKDTILQTLPLLNQASIDSGFAQSTKNQQIHFDVTININNSAEPIGNSNEPSQYKMAKEEPIDDSSDPTDSLPHLFSIDSDTSIAEKIDKDVTGLASFPPDRPIAPIVTRRPAMSANQSPEIESKNGTIQTAKSGGQLVFRRPTRTFVSNDRILDPTTIASTISQAQNKNTSSRSHGPSASK